VTKAEQMRQRLLESGTQLTWSVDSGVFLLDGERWIIWVHPEPTGRPFLVAPLPVKFGEDPYDAARDFLDRQLRAGWPEVGWGDEEA